MSTRRKKPLAVQPEHVDLVNRIACEVRGKLADVMPWLELEELASYGKLELAKLIRKYKQGPGGNFRPFAVQRLRWLLRNYAQKLQRDRKRETQCSDAILNSIPAREPVSDDGVRDICRQLEATQTEIIVLRYVHKWRIQDIADTLGLTRTEVIRLHAKAIAALRRFWGAQLCALANADCPREAPESSRRPSP